MVSSFSRRVGAMLCAEVALQKKEDSIYFGNLEINMVLQECNVKATGEFTADVKGSYVYKERTIIMRCCPPEVSWSELSCPDWSETCNAILKCFKIWKDSVNPMQMRLSEIFYSDPSKYIFVSVFLIEMVFVVVKAIINE